MQHPCRCLCRQRRLRCLCTRYLCWGHSVVLRNLNEVPVAVGSGRPPNSCRHPCQHEFKASNGRAGRDRAANQEAVHRMVSLGEATDEARAGTASVNTAPCLLCLVIVLGTAALRSLCPCDAPAIAPALLLAFRLSPSPSRGVEPFAHSCATHRSRPPATTTLRWRGSSLAAVATPKPARRWMCASRSGDAMSTLCCLTWP